MGMIDHAHSQQNEENNANGGNEGTDDYQEDTENRDAVLESLKVPITVLSIMETSIP